MIFLYVDNDKTDNIERDVKQYLVSKSIIQVVNLTDARKKQKGISSKSILREIADNEIVIEFDTDDKKRVNKLIQKTVKKLFYNKYNFVVYDHGGRSPHIHVYDIKGLDEQNYNSRREYKRLFLAKYANYKETDVTLNTSSSHLIAIEGKKHFKHKKEKKIIMANYDGIISNKLEYRLIDRAVMECDKIYTTNLNFDKDEYWWLINWAKKAKFKTGNVNNIFLKNLAITMVNNDCTSEMVMNDLVKMYGYKVRGKLYGWMKWAKRKPRHVNPCELIEFADDQNLNFRGARNEFFRKFSK